MRLPERWLAALALGLLLAGPALAVPADVVNAEARCKGDRCSFVVSVRHDDKGWEDWADRFEILDMQGHVLATRAFRHPHVEEQPVTRDLRDAKIPIDVTRVRVRAHDSVDGYGGEERTLVLHHEPVAPATAKTATR